jgi:hypothetical protein
MATIDYRDTNKDHASPMIVIHKQEVNGTYNQVLDMDELKQFIRHETNRVIRAVNADSSIEEQLLAENTRLRKQLQDLLSGATLPDEVQSKVNQVFAEAEQNTKKLQDMLNEGKENKSSL